MASIALNDDSAAQTAIDVLLRDYSEHKEIDKLISPIVQRYINKIFQGVKQGASFEDLETYDGLLRTFCEYILQNHPYSEHAIRAQRGIVFADIYKGDYAAAQAGMEILIAQYPDHKDLAQVLHWLGNDFLRMKQYTKARTCYQYIADHWPQADHGLLGDARMIRCNIRLNQDEQILTAVDAIMTKFPGHSDLSKAVFMIGEEYYNIALEQSKEGKTQAAKENFAKALPIWQKIVDNLPDTEYAPHAHDFVAGCYRKLVVCQDCICG